MGLKFYSNQAKRIIQQQLYQFTLSYIGFVFITFDRIFLELNHEIDLNEKYFWLISTEIQWMTTRIKLKTTGFFYLFLLIGLKVYKIYIHTIAI